MVPVYSSVVRNALHKFSYMLLLLLLEIPVKNDLTMTDQIVLSYVGLRWWFEPSGRFTIGFIAYRERLFYSGSSWLRKSTLTIQPTGSQLWMADYIKQLFRNTRALFGGKVRLCFRPTMCSCWVCTVIGRFRVSTTVTGW